MNKKKITSIILIILFSANIFAQEHDQEPEAEQKDTVPVFPVNFQPVPAINIFAPFIRTNDIFLLGMFMGIGYELSGFAMSPVASINYGVARGVQFAGLFNVASDDIYGVQISPGLNVASKNIWGLQLAPLNIRSDTESDGVSIMIGLVNVSKSPNVIPFGLINIIDKGERHFIAYMDESAFLNAGFRSGIKHFYSYFGYGFGGGLLPGRDGDNLILPRGGFGFEYSINNLFFDLEFIRGNIKKLNDFGFKDIFLFFFGSNTEMYQIRFKTGYKFHKRFGIFAGISWDYLNQQKRSDPSPDDLGGMILDRWNDGKSVSRLGFFGGMQF